MYTSDTLSGMSANAQASASLENLIDRDKMVSYTSSIIQALPGSDVKLQNCIQAQENGSVCRKLEEYILERWPEKCQISDFLKPYWNFRGDFSIVQNVILKSM